MEHLNGQHLPVVHSREELTALVREIGFLPAFRGAIPGFSAEECIAPEYWFPERGEGFWEWKGPVIQSSGCAYGKFLGGRAAFIMPAWYREFANARRNGYDFDALYEDGLARRRDKEVFDVLWAHGSLLSKELSRLCSDGAGRKDFYEIMTRLQMQGYALISNFEYQISKKGRPYGWGVTRYETPERRFGAPFTDAVYAHRPAESKRLLFAYLRELLPDADESAVLRLIG